MSTLKKILALSLALAMILSVSVFAGYTTDSYKDAAAIDKDAAEAVELMYALDIMTGDEKGNFNPNATITRAEVAKMIYVILNKGKDDKAATYAAAQLFTDVPSTAWYAGYINYLAAVGLVNGSEGKFYPTNPVKTAEAAKMLLTAIGYNSEDRQYVGANWAKNVLNDASIVGLLSSTYKYGADINGAAPRQWVAVMFANALLDAFTFNTVVPSGYNGIFGSGTAVAGTDKFIKFGKKYYNLYDNEVYAYATPTAYIDTIEKATNHYATKNYVLFSDGNEFKGTGLGYMDLGQKYRVIARGDKALSVRPVTSVVADATVAEITYKFEYNKGSSTRMFTIGDMTASFADTKINAFSNYKTKDGKASAVDFTESNLIGKLDAQCNDLVRAIDRNGDGEIDYIILVYSDYAYVNKAATDKSGDYVIFGDPYTGKATTGKLWLGGAVACDEELVAGNFVKSTWNLDNGNYDLEVLPVATEVKYTKKTGIKTPVYTIGDVEYLLASKGFTDNAKMAELKKNTKTNVAYDEGLAVYVGKYTFAYTDIEDIYNQLGVFVENFTMNSSIRPNRNVDGVAYYNITPELLEEELDKDSAKPEGADAYKLFAVSVDEESGTTLTRLTEQNFLKALSADKDLVAAFKTGKGTLNGKKDSFAFSSAHTYKPANKFDADAKFFVITKSGSKVVVEVKTIDEIEDKTYNNIYAELFYSPEDAKGNATIVGGLLDFRTQTYGETNDYFFIVDALDEYGKPVVNSKTVKVNGNDTTVWNRTVRVMFSDESVDDVDLRFDSKDAATKAVLKEDALYAYKYDGDADVYTLKEIQEDNNGFDFVDGKSFNDPDTTGNWEIAKDRLADFGELVFAVKNSDAKDDYRSEVMNKFDEDTVIALTVKHYSNNKDHELMSVEHYFTDIDGLAAILEEEGNLTIVNGMEVTTGEVESFTCYSDVDSRSGALLNICIYADDLWTD